MLAYDHQGWGGCINVLDEYFPHVTERVHVIDMLHMFSDAFLRCHCRWNQRFCSQLYQGLSPQNSRWPKSTTNKISLLRVIIFEVVCGVNLIKPFFRVLNKWMDHGNASKNGGLCRCCPKKSINKSTQKQKQKNALGPTAGHGATTQPCCNLWFLRCHKGSGTALWHWTSTRGKNWRSECRPDMIRMIENHFFVFFTHEKQNRVTAQAKRLFSLLSHTPANRNGSLCCKHFLATSGKYQHFVS